MSEKKYLTLIILLAFLSVFLNLSCFNCCLVGGTTSFEVNVEDEFGDGIEEAEVKITDSNGDSIFEETEADDDGILEVDNLEFESGEDYTITAKHEDYETESKTEVNFDENTDETYEFSLSEDEPKPTKLTNPLIIYRQLFSDRFKQSCQQTLT